MKTQKKNQFPENETKDAITSVMIAFLSNRGWVADISEWCVQAAVTQTNIGSDKGLRHVWYQTIILSNDILFFNQDTRIEF